MTHSSGRAETKMAPITVAVRRFIGYKYLLHLALITISHSSFLSWLGFTFLVLRLQSMDDKRGTKRARSHFKEGSPSPDGAKTPPPAPSGSPPPLTSPPEVSSHCPRSPVWEQGGSYRKAPVVDLSSSSDEGDLIVDVLRDEEYTRRFFGDINRDVLGPPDDDKIIILNDSDEQEEVCEKKAADTEAMPSSAARSSAPTVSTVDADGTYKSNTPDRATGGCSSSGDEAGLP
jgi:hypothetical protein